MSKVSNGTKKPNGRPSLYTPELGQEICYLLTEGLSLRAICEQEGMPTWRTVMNWLHFNRDERFFQQYTRAREAQADWCADAAPDIALTRERDIPLENGRGGYSADTTAVQRDKLIFEALKWKASILAPKKYGAKIQQELTGAEGAALTPFISVSVKDPSDT